MSDEGFEENIMALTADLKQVFEKYFDKMDNDIYISKLQAFRENGAFSFLMRCAELRFK